MVITGVENGSPDMILTAFDGKFDEKKDEIPPGAFRSQNKLKKTMSTKWTTNKLKKNNVEKVGPQKVEKKQCCQSGFIYAYIPSYTFIYLNIPSNSVK